ncbi:cholesterol catabolism transcriptional regulator KstR [Sciscionella sediminilitoris]|uniref:cholesterol catabolism transcriptional regulator KstR n=1 Tax=Sciscionella sediminilitoris TaxID=1445613 RepID=UPI000564FFED|nr:cholesterol catabolism transcriptional regulator KstR [Sciscionella sp. SE31]
MSEQQLAQPVKTARTTRTTAQQQRRERILDATIGLASKGGYDAVQMRAVADDAGVALGTLYRYFPSKIHLLVSSLGREFSSAQARFSRRTIPGETAAERLLYLLGRVTKSLQRDPLLTEAVTRAFMFADTSAAAEIDEVGQALESMFSHAVRGDEELTERDRVVIRIVSDVWLSNLVSWVTRRASARDVTTRLELTVQLLLGDGEISGSW